jgi:aryl-alcohol dehydrogenase-like predicted oxidoreductase
MPLSIAGHPDEIAALAMIEAFVEVGGDFIDTANVYCLDDVDIGHNKRLPDRALRRIDKRDAVVIATKGGSVAEQARNIALQNKIIGDH